MWSSLDYNDLAGEDKVDEEELFDCNDLDGGEKVDEEEQQQNYEKNKSQAFNNDQCSLQINVIHTTLLCPSCLHPPRK